MEQSIDFFISSRYYNIAKRLKGGKNMTERQIEERKCEICEICQYLKDLTPEQKQAVRQFELFLNFTNSFRKSNPKTG